MAMFERVATAQLNLLFYVLLLGHAFLAVPANPANACSTDLYLRVVLTHHYLVLTALAAGMLLLAVSAWVRVAKAADHKGIGSVAAGERRSLRGMLLLAAVLSFAASVLAVVTSEYGFLYRSGCGGAYQAGYGVGAGSPLGVMTMRLLALLHGFFA